MSKIRVRRHSRRGRPVREFERIRSRYPTRRKLNRRERALLEEWGEPWGSEEIGRE